MKKYRFTRDLDGSPEGSTRTLSVDDAKALVDSGALVLDGDADEGAPPAAIEPAPVDPAPQAAEAAPVPSVTAEQKPARRAKSN